MSSKEHSREVDNRVAEVPSLVILWSGFDVKLCPTGQLEYTILELQLTLSARTPDGKRHKKKKKQLCVYKFNKCGSCPMYGQREIGNVSISNESHQEDAGETVSGKDISNQEIVTN